MTTALVVLAVAVGIIPVVVGAALVLVFVGAVLFTLADLLRCPPLGLAGSIIGAPGAIVLFLVALAMGETS